MAIIVLPFTLVREELRSPELTFNVAHFIMFVNMFRPKLSWMGKIPHMRLEYKHATTDKGFHKLEVRYTFYLLVTCFVLSLFYKVNFPANLGDGELSISGERRAI